MFSNISFPKDPISIISQNEEKEKTFNDEIYHSLNIKKKLIQMKYNDIKEDKPESILSYHMFHPFKISYNHNTKFLISKEDLNKLLADLYEKSKHKEIFASKLFELSNPYHLIVEKNYISQKYVSEEIKAKFEEEKNYMIEREYALSPNEYYDKNNQIYLRFGSKINKLNKLKNNILIRKAVAKCDILVRIKNEEDCFDKYFLLNPGFKICDLRSLIAFVYKTRLFVENPGEITLFYYNDIYRQIYIEDGNKTLLDIRKEKNCDYVLEIYINTEY